MVKHPSGYDGASGSGQRLSGSKRSMAEPFVSNANGSSLTKRYKLHAFVPIIIMYGVSIIMNLCFSKL